MKIFGSHNTQSRTAALKHQVAKLFLDRATGAICINQRMLDLLGITRNEYTFILFVEDDNGVLGICKTNDKDIGIQLHWYKHDLRARVFNQTMVTYMMQKYKLKDSSSSYHLVFYQLPVTAKSLIVYQVNKVFPYRREMEKKE